MRVGFAVTRAASMTDTWTTVHLIWAALQLGHRVRVIEPADHEVDVNHQLLLRAHCFDQPTESPGAIAESLQDRKAQRRAMPLAQLDLLLLRASPLDPSILSFCHMAQSVGVPVVNDPSGALMVSHKAWLAAQAGIPMPRGVVTRRTGAAWRFFDGCKQGAVVKPARGSGGKAVQRVRRGDDEGFEDALQAASDRGDGYVVIQEYLPGATKGEKRLLWLDGTIIGGYLRRRAEGEWRHNLKLGGHAERCDITAAEHAAVACLSPALLRAGIRTAGLDLIDGKITEVNALNPGGAFHTDRLTGSRTAELIISRLTEHPRTEDPNGLTPSPH